MWIVFKSTIRDIMKKKSNIYLLFFGALFFIIGYGIKFSIKEGSNDLSLYGKYFVFSIFIYIFYATIVIIAGGDLEDENNDGFTEISILSISRPSYFYGKYLAYIVCFTVVLEFITILGVFFSKLLGVPFNWKILVGMPGLATNIAFVIAIVIILSLKANMKGASFIALMAYILLSLTNSYGIMKTLLRSDAIAKIVSWTFPAIFKYQSEFISYGVGFGFSEEFIYKAFNMGIYLVLLNLFMFNKMKKYESIAK